MLKKVFFINHAPKEFHNLLLVFVVSGMLLTSVCLFYGTKTVYKTSTIEASETAVKSSYELVVKDGYKKTIEDFEELLINNEQAVKDAAELTKVKYPTIDTRNFDLGRFDCCDEGYEQKFRMKMGLPFEHYNEVPNWIGRFLAFASCWAGIALTLLFLNFTLKPIANRYKYFWFVPYILSIAIPSFLGVIVMFILAG